MEDLLNTDRSLFRLLADEVVAQLRKIGQSALTTFISRERAHEAVAIAKDECWLVIGEALGHE